MRTRSGRGAYFNPRSHEGSDFLRGGIFQRMGISIHAPTRGATITIPNSYTSRRYFNPRSHEGSDSSSDTCIRRRTGYFNPRSHEGSDRSVMYSIGQCGISIHAPTRGATFSFFSQASSQLYFNPRSHEGSDFSIFFSSQIIFPISIHAPTRGATRALEDFLRDCEISIHAPTRGATCPCFLNFYIPQFQSTLPRGERRATANLSTVTRKDFNPRSHEGSDIKALQKWAGVTISIHAPTRGATAILSKIHPMFLTISHNASSFSSFPFHSFLPHLLNSSTFCALFQVRISRAFSVYYRFAPKKSTPDLQLYHVLHRYVQL